MTDFKDGFNIKKFLDDNQIIKLNKVGNFKPYSFTHGVNDIQLKIHDLEEYKKLDLDNDKLIDYELNDLYAVLEEASELLNKLGLKSQTFKVLFLDISSNIDLISKTADDEEGYYGFSIPGSSTIIIDKELVFDNLQMLLETILHETAHSYWFQLNKETKTWFKQWYDLNVLNKIINGKLDDDDVDLIWNSFKGSNLHPKKAITKVIPDLVLDVFENKYGDVKDNLIVKPVIDTFKSTFNRNKDILDDEKSFKQILQRIRFKFSSLQSSDAAELRALAYEQGLTPSEYAAHNPSELWAETVRYAALNLGNISSELKKALVTVISGTV